VAILNEEVVSALILVAVAIVVLLIQVILVFFLVFVADVTILLILRGFRMLGRLLARGDSMDRISIVDSERSCNADYVCVLFINFRLMLNLLLTSILLRLLLLRRRP
jgi:hypothetical protein